MKNQTKYATENAISEAILAEREKRLEKAEKAVSKLKEKTSLIRAKIESLENELDYTIYQLAKAEAELVVSQAEAEAVKALSEAEANAEASYTSANGHKLIKL